METSIPKGSIIESSQFNIMSKSTRFQHENILSLEFLENFLDFVNYGRNAQAAITASPERIPTQFGIESPPRPPLKYINLLSSTNCTFCSCFSLLKISFSSSPPSNSAFSSPSTSSLTASFSTFLLPSYSSPFTSSVPTHILYLLS